MPLTVSIIGERRKKWIMKMGDIVFLLSSYALVAFFDFGVFESQGLFDGCDHSNSKEGLLMDGCHQYFRQAAMVCRWSNQCIAHMWYAGGAFIGAYTVHVFTYLKNK